MADGTPTVNYGWIKPNVGASADVWGGEMNANLDGIDATVYALASSSGGGGSPYPQDNRIINGDMRIDQRNSGALGTASGVYTIDRWGYLGTVAGKLTWQRQASTLPGFPYMLTFTSLSAYTSAANDYFYFDQPIEADMISDFAWGTASAHPVTLSFWAISSLTGTFSGTANNQNSPFRSYPFTYSIPAANTWTRITVTIPGDTAGAWNMTGNLIGLTIFFDLGCGANGRGPANAWGTGNLVGANGAASLVATNGATLSLTGVKLEIGSVATPFNRQSLAKSMADCQRYYQVLGGAQILVAGYNGAGSGINNCLPYPVVMRASPTVTFSGVTYANASSLTTGGVTSNMVTTQCLITALGSGYAIGTMQMSAEL